MLDGISIGSRITCFVSLKKFCVLSTHCVNYCYVFINDHMTSYDITKVRTVISEVVNKTVFSKEVCMETNTNVSNGSGEELGIYCITYPFYAVYLKMFLLLLLALLIVVSSSMVIFAMLKDKKLKNFNNLLIVNLLVSDLIFILAHFSRIVYLSSIYLFGIKLYDFCKVTVPITSFLSRGSTLMAIPLIFYRVVSIIRPFSYKRIMTKKRIIVMIVWLWVFAVVISVVAATSYRVSYVPSLAACAIVDIHPVSIVIFCVPEVLCFVLLLLASAYLRYKIIKSNQFFHGIQRNTSDREKAVREGTLVEVLMEQVKPTLSVLITGGIDGLFDLMLIVCFISSNGLPSTTQFLVQQIVGFSLLYCQSLSRALCFGLYSKKIREKVFAFYPRQSRVIILNTRL